MNFLVFLTREPRTEKDIFCVSSKGNYLLVPTLPLHHSNDISNAVQTLADEWIHRERRTMKELDMFSKRVRGGGNGRPQNKNRIVAMTQNIEGVGCLIVKSRC